MASDKEYLQYVLDQLSELEEITYRSMMGEFMIYYRGKIAAYLCDNRLLVKILPATVGLMPEAARETPYPGAKEMLLVHRIDDRFFLKNLFETMYPELPEPTKRKKSIKQPPNG